MQNRTKNDQNITSDAIMENDQHKALTVARIYFQGHIKDPDAASYVGTRGLSREALRTFEIGYAPDAWRGLVDHFSSHKIRLAAVDAGILTTPAQSNRLLDFFRNRLMFPIRDHLGELVGYGGRTLSKDDGVPKYINTPETALFNKSKLLYGLHQNHDSITTSGEAMLVEGYMDVVTLHSHGYTKAVAPMGTAVTSDQIHLLLDHGVKRLFVCLDGDGAGIRAAGRSIDVIMQSYHPTMDVRIVLMPDGHDPDSLVRERGLVGLHKAMAEAKGLADFILEACIPGKQCSSLEDKVAFMLRVKDYAEQASGILREQIIAGVQTITDLDMTTVRECLTVNADDSIGWHPLVAQSARWVYHQSGQAAAILDDYPSINGHGLDDLRQLIADTACANPLAKYAKAHGPLTDIELHSIGNDLDRWLRRTQLEQQLSSALDRPYDRGIREGIRQTLGLG